MQTKTKKDTCRWEQIPSFKEYDKTTTSSREWMDEPRGKVFNSSWQRLQNQ